MEAPPPAGLLFAHEPHQERHPRAALGRGRRRWGRRRGAACPDSRDLPALLALRAPLPALAVGDGGLRRPAAGHRDRVDLAVQARRRRRPRAARLRAVRLDRAGLPGPDAAVGTRLAPRRLPAGLDRRALPAGAAHGLLPPPAEPVAGLLRAQAPG